MIPIENGRLLQRPGISQLNTTGKVARGQFVWNGSLYQVVSGDLIKITNTTTGAFSVIGAISGSDVIKTAVGFNTAVIMVKGGSMYTLDKSDTLVDISGNSNIVPSVDVAHIDGRFIYIPANGDPAYFSDVGAAGTVQGLSFFDAEELPDLNSGVFNLRNTLGIAGTDSIEFFRNTVTTVANPFLRIQGARVDIGLIGGLLEYGNTFVFIGRKKNEGVGVFALDQKISNEAIDLILSTYTVSELSNALPGRFNWRGYDIATFTLSRDSFGFYNGKWFPLETFAGGLSSPWSGGHIVQFEGEYFTAFSDKIGKLAKVNTDYGDPMTRIIDIGFEQEDDDNFSTQSLILGVSQGFNASEGSVGLFMSRDNVQYGSPVFRTLGGSGEYQDKLVWNYPGGLGNYKGFMGARIYTTQDVDLSSEYLVANFR
jgi:hypothetical protein